VELRRGEGPGRIPGRGREPRAPRARKKKAKKRKNRRGAKKQKRAKKQSNARRLVKKLPQGVKMSNQLL